MQLSFVSKPLLHVFSRPVPFAKPTTAPWQLWQSQLALHQNRFQVLYFFKAVSGQVQNPIYIVLRGLVRRSAIFDV